MATNVGSIYYEIGLQTGSFNNAIAGVNKSVTNAGLSFNKMALAVAVGQGALQALNATVRLVGRGIDLMTDFVKDSIESAMEAEEVNAKLTQSFKNGSDATDEQTQSLIDYANILQFKVGIDDENIKSGMAMLGTFKLNTEQVKTMIPALLDMAVMYRKNTGEQIDLTQTAIMLGKATGGELYRNLQRVGVIFDDNQLAMLENADAAGRLLIVTQELDNEFGGQALIAAGTFGGKIQILSLYFDELKETVGTAIIDALAPFIDKLMTWAASDEGQRKIEEITTAVVNMARDMTNWVVNVAIPWITKYWPEIVRGIQNTINVFAVLGQGLKIIGLLFVGVGDGIARFLYTTQQIIGWVVNGIVSFFGTLWEIASRVINNIIGLIQGLLGWLGLINNTQTNVNINTNRTYTGGEIGIGVGYSANGTDYWRGGMTWVGERGPELVNLPRGSQVIPNHELPSTTTATFTGNIYLGDSSAVDSFFSRLSRNQELASKGMATL